MTISADLRTALPPESVGEAAGMRPPTTQPRPSRRRQTAFVVATATVLGLWFGMAAPSVSPVTPTGPDPAAVSVAAAPLVPAPADPVAPAPVDPALPPPLDPAAPAGHGTQADQDRPPGTQGRPGGGFDGGRR